MRSLPRPNATVAEVLRLCIASLRDAGLKTRLSNIEGLLTAAEAAFLSHGRRGQLFRVRASARVNRQISRSRMIWLYDNKLSRQRTSARRIYDAIKAAPTHGICPLCAQRVVTQLDHYLAKARHGLLAITPLNLVPSCSDCNKAKLHREATRVGEQTFHPYFDILGGEVWLSATLLQTTPLVVEYAAVPPAGWSRVRSNRLAAHFQTFGLAELYSTQAAVELTGTKAVMVETAQASGADGLRLHLQAQARSRAQPESNSWQAALYRALASSDWFCNGGYSQIA